MVFQENWATSSFVWLLCWLVSSFMTIQCHTLVEIFRILILVYAVSWCIFICPSLSDIDSEHYCEHVTGDLATSSFHFPVMWTWEWCMHLLDWCMMLKFWMAIMIFQKSVIGNFPVKYKIMSCQPYLGFGMVEVTRKLETRHEILSVSTL